jgi:hypothetical protein
LTGALQTLVNAGIITDAIKYAKTTLRPQGLQLGVWNNVSASSAAGKNYSAPLCFAYSLSVSKILTFTWYVVSFIVVLNPFSITRLLLEIVCSLFLSLGS